MKKQLLSIATIAALNTNSIADTVADAFKNGKASGEIRIGYVNQGNSDATTNKNSAVGGHLAYKSAAVNGVSAGVALYMTHRFESKDSDGEGTGLFDSSDDSYSILGEAYINVAMGKTNFKAGRQQINTPYADSDDIRMIPNLFEAYVVSNSDIENLTLIAAKIKKWSGVDADISEKFTNIVADGNGALILSAIYEGIENTELSVWHYSVDKYSKITYLEGTTKVGLGDGLALALSAQYANISEENNSNADAKVWGISAELGIESAGTTLMAAYNNVSAEVNSGHSATNGFGGGPYMTSMDETTIDALIGNLEAWIAGVSFDMGAIANINGLSVSYAHGEFEDGQNTTLKEERKESNFTVEYEFNNNLSTAIIYTDMEHKTGGTMQDDSFDRLQAYATYSF